MLHLLIALIFSTTSLSLFSSQVSLKVKTDEAFVSQDDITVEHVQGTLSPQNAFLALQAIAGKKNKILEKNFDKLESTSVLYLAKKYVGTALLQGGLTVQQSSSLAHEMQNMVKTAYSLEYALGINLQVEEQRYAANKDVFVERLSRRDVSARAQTPSFDEAISDSIEL